MAVKRQCRGKTKAGARCPRAAMKGSHYCFNHNPKVAAKRARHHRNAARKKVAVALLQDPGDLNSLSGLQRLTARLLDKLLTTPTTTPEHTVRAVASLLQRQTALLTSDVVTRSDLLTLMQEMARVVDEAVSDDAVKRRIGTGWLDVRRRMSLEGYMAPETEEERREREAEERRIRRAPRPDVKHAVPPRKHASTKHVHGGV